VLEPRALVAALWSVHAALGFVAGGIVAPRLLGRQPGERLIDSGRALAESAT
jgi:hypothetical protein